MPTCRIVVGTLMGVALLAGCGRAPASAPQQAGSKAETPRAAGAPSSEEARELCLANPDGNGPLDQELRAAQKRARKLSVKSDEWASVGRQWVRKARLASDSGFYVNVDGCAAVALQLEPDLAPALELRGLVLMNGHSFEQAREVAEQVLRRDPDNVVALGTLSDALLELGRYDDAARAAQRQMDTRPGMAAYARGSYIRWLKGDTRNAKLFIRDALIGRDARDPEPAAWTFVEAATIFWHVADYDGSDAVYAKALEWVPDYPTALVGRARIALARRQPERAVEYLEKANRIRPLSETAWLLGDAREMSGDTAGARKAYEETVRQGRRGDRLTLALFYATKNRDVEEALRLVEEERLGRGGIYVDDTYAWTLYRAGRIEEARQASDRAIRLGTQDARLLYHAGAIRVAGGDSAAGRKLVRQALALNPHFDWTGAAEARALLETEPQRMASR